MIDKAKFFKKDFNVPRKVYCEKCEDTTLHTLTVVEDTPVKAKRVLLYSCCHDCLEKSIALQAIGIESDFRITKRFILAPAWEWLNLNEGYLDYP